MITPIQQNILIRIVIYWMMNTSHRSKFLACIISLDPVTTLGCHLYWAVEEDSTVTRLLSQEAAKL